ncbi:MAG: hypothetical protein QOF24_3097 [Verrucomicrobiota bacterium]|jgi:hypothetical protein
MGALSCEHGERGLLRIRFCESGIVFREIARVGAIAFDIAAQQIPLADLERLRVQAQPLQFSPAGGLTFLDF